MKKFKSFGAFANEVANDSNLEQQLQADPKGTLNQIKIEDKWVYRFAIWILGIVVILILLGSLFILKEPEKTPEFMIAIASTALGAIAGLISQNT